MIKEGCLNPAFWKSKRILLTGHTGFKGAWLSYWLLQLGADVIGYSLAPNTVPSLFEILKLEKILDHNVGDIRDIEVFKKVVSATRPDIVLHLAAQPIVSSGYDDPVGTFGTNIMGVVNLLDIFKNYDNQIPLLIISSDKCYLNEGMGIPFKISDPLGGHDPYSASKAGTEIVVAAYSSSYFQREKGPQLASARAGNVIGGGDWSTNRLIPDAAAAFKLGNSLQIRNPLATRPWQHVLEPLYGYMMLIQAMFGAKGFNGPWNFGPNSDNVKTVEAISRLFAQRWGKNVTVEISKNKQHWKEAKSLELDVSKTSRELNFQTVLNIEETVYWTADWYKHFYDNPTTSTTRELCKNQIIEYTLKQQLERRDA